MIAWIVLAISAAIVFYILIGYPLLLAAMGERGSKPLKNLQYQTSVTAVLAVYNGAAFLRAKLESLLAQDYPRDLLDIIVVSDGSTDDTDAIATEYADRRVSLIRVPHGGKAAALNAALKRATGEILFFTDVRQALEPHALRHLVANFADPEIGAVTGELKLLKGESGEQADMDLYWRYEVWARKRHSAIYSLFNTTGCIYAIRRSLAAPLSPDTLTDDAVLPLRAYFAGYRIILDTEAVAYDYPAVAGTEFRRRVRTLAGLWQTYRRFPRLLSPRNPMLLHFTSHKFARLLLPWAILAVYASTVALPPSATKSFLLIDEAALLVLAGIDRFVPKGLLKRLTSPARSFIVMNAAAMVSIMVFFVDPKRFWVPTRVAARKHTA